MINKIILSIVLIASSTVLASTKDYMEKMTIKLKGKSSGYTFAVPRKVYQDSYYPDLRDMRIINASGDFVPMRTVLPKPEVVNEYSQTTLPIFKLNKTITTSVESKQTRTTVSGTKEDYTVTTSNSLNKYLETLEVEDSNQIIIDATVVKGQKIETLEINWQFEKQGNRILFVDLLASNDLSNWKVIRNKQQLVELTTNEKTILDM